MAATQTGSKISQHSWKQNSNANVHIFDVAKFNNVVNLGGRRNYFRYNATSGCVGDNVIEAGDIENMDVGVGILLLCVLKLGI